jgi:hypothetical protein
LCESSIRPLAELLKIVLSIFNVAIAYFRTESKSKIELLRETYLSFQTNFELAPLALTQNWFQGLIIFHWVTGRIGFQPRKEPIASARLIEIWVSVPPYFCCH